MMRFRLIVQMEHITVHTQTNNNYGMSDLAQIDGNYEIPPILFP